jgi:hypothetical protein
MKKILSILGLTLLLLAPPTLLLAQVDDGDDVVDTPLDGGLTLLLAAGAGLGAKKVYDLRRKKKQQGEKGE